MATIRYRDRESSATGALFVAVGALAGLATGVLLAQRYGGLSAISQRVRDRLGDAAQHEDEDEARFGPSGHDVPEYDDEPLGDDADEGEMLEERVLEAFRNDPVLSERAIDIGAIGTGIIELTGWVHAEDETHHAVTVTRGVPGVDTVVNRLTVRDEEDRYDEQGRRYESGEEETSPRWEGMGIGTGRPRQGTSNEPDRHADPKPILDGWKLLESTAIYRASNKNPFHGKDSTTPTVGQILLMSKEALMRRVVRNPRIEIYDCGERDIKGGRIDRRVLASLEFLAASGMRPTVTSLQCGHGVYTASGNVSHHSSGNAVDIAKINGTPIIGNQGNGSVTDMAVRRLITLDQQHPGTGTCCGGRGPQAGQTGPENHNVAHTSPSLQALWE